MACGHISRVLCEFCEIKKNNAIYGDHIHLYIRKLIRKTKPFFELCWIQCELHVKINPVTVLV